MFGKMVQPLVPFENVPPIAADAVIEFACPECRRVLSRRGLVVGRVLHRFSIWTGEFLKTIHQP